jgi:hypothetical protein
MVSIVKVKPWRNTLHLKSVVGVDLVVSLFLSATTNPASDPGTLEQSVAQGTWWKGNIGFSL